MSQSQIPESKHFITILFPIYPTSQVPALILVTSDSSVFPYIPDLLCPCVFVPASFLPGTLACLRSQNWQIHLIDPSEDPAEMLPFLAPQVKSVIVKKNVLV